MKNIKKISPICSEETFKADHLINQGVKLKDTAKQQTELSWIMLEQQDLVI